MDPQKIYDYLASGKPIVTTPVAGAERFADLVEIASTPMQFICAVDRALAEGDLDREARLQAASANSWDERVERLWAVLSTDDNPASRAAPSRDGARSRSSRESAACLGGTQGRAA